MAGGLRLGADSGAHLNPAVSLAFALRSDFPWTRVPGLDEARASRRQALRDAAGGGSAGRYALTMVSHGLNR